MKQYYPDLQNQTYFIPPWNFYRVSYKIREVAGQKVLVPNIPSPGLAYTHPDPSDERQDAKTEGRPVASQAWLDVPPDLFQKVYGADAMEDHALQQVLHYIRDKADKFKEVMVVISKLHFRKFLDQNVNPLCTMSLMHDSKTYQTGGFDLLIISRRHGLILGEMATVGDYSNKAVDFNVVVKKVQQLIKQLNKAESVLSHLVSDLPSVNITKTLILSNLTSQQLQQALATNGEVTQSLCQCLGAPSVSAAMEMCLCDDSLESDAWWKRLQTADGPRDALPPELYEELTTILCVPAITVQIPAVRCTTQAFRSMGEAVAETGRRMARITLYPAQVHLVDSKGLWRTYLAGPPGTGKTIVLIIKGVQWVSRGKHVHVVSTWEKSIAASYLIQYQLSGAASSRQVHLHLYNLNNSDNVHTAVSQLVKLVQDDELYVIADEAGPDDGPHFQDFCAMLCERVKILRLWAASVGHRRIPSCLREKRLTVPLRCPPSVVREVAQAPEFRRGQVLEYTLSKTLAPTDGPPVLWKFHHNQSEHADGEPEDCYFCGVIIYEVLRQLHVGPKGFLEYRDVLILCHRVDKDLRVLKHMETQGIPFVVVTSTEDAQDVRDVALATVDQVTVASTKTIFGLERRVVFWIGPVEAGRLDAMSRCTAQLVVFPGTPLQAARGDDDEELSSSDESGFCSETEVDPSEYEDTPTLPVICENWQVTKTFCSAGGQLRGEDSDVILHVPEGAITHSDDVTIQGAVSTDLKNAHEKLGLGRDETIVSPVVEFFAENTEFLKPVRIALPCFFSSLDPETFRVYRFHSDRFGDLQSERLQPCQSQGELSETDAAYVFVSELQQIHVLTRHFTGYACAQCQTKKTPPALRLRMYGTHTHRDTRNIDLILFLWDTRLDIKDFRKDLLQNQEYEENFLATKTLAPLQDANNVEVGVQLEMNEREQEMWIFSKPGEGDEQKLELRDFFPCCLDPSPERVDFVLENRPGKTPGQWFECAVHVGYVRAGEDTLNFLPTPRKKTLHVRGLELGKGEASTQTEAQTAEKTYVSSLPTQRPLMTFRSNAAADEADDNAGAHAGVTDGVPLSPPVQDTSYPHNELGMQEQPLGAGAVATVVSRGQAAAGQTDVPSCCHSSSCCEEYRMERPGICLVINNRSFKLARDAGKDLEDRDGTDKDANVLRNVFEGLFRFKVNEVQDCTGEGIQQALLDQFTELERGRCEYDCFACVILTHGDKDGILGVDGNPVSLEFLKEINIKYDDNGDKSPRCPSLVGKPKVFFIQACQGAETDQGTRRVAVDGPELESPAASLTPAAPPRGTSNRPPEVSAQHVVGKCPLLADIYIAKAVVSGYKCYRHTMDGTWFIQTLASVFRAHAHNSDLHSLMTRISHDVGCTQTKDGHTQQPEVHTCTLTKKLFFRPASSPSRLSTVTSIAQRPSRLAPTGP